MIHLFSEESILSVATGKGRGEKSYLQLFLYGVPQGAKPVKIYIKLQGEAMHHFGVQYHQYAYIIQLYISSSSSTDETVNDPMPGSLGVDFLSVLTRLFLTIWNPYIKDVTICILCVSCTFFLIGCPFRDLFIPPSPPAQVIAVSSI